MSAMLDSLVLRVEEQADYSCSLECFKVHKESCVPTKATTEPSDVVEDNPRKSTRGDKASADLTREYNLLSPGQLAALRNNSISTS